MARVGCRNSTCLKRSFAGSSTVFGRSVGSDDESSDPVRPVRPDAGATPPLRARLTRLAFLLFGLVVAFYLGRQGPQEQHVRVVLGAAAPDVTGVDLQYVGQDGDVVREAHFIYPKGGAPRVVAHEPKLPDGQYRLQIDVDARD